MTRRAYIIGVLAAGMAISAAYSSPVYTRLASSAHIFQQSFRDLEEAGESLSPVERFVLSLILANSKAPQADSPSVVPRHRT
jgi:hypothetical protein